MIAAASVILLSALAALLLSWFYFRRAAIARPPIGVTNAWDIIFLMVGILIIPYLYLLLPLWLVTAVLCLETGSLIYFVGEPLVKAKLALWLLAIVPVAADVAAAILFGVHSGVFYFVNNLVLILVVVGVSNIWAQGGMQARHAAVLAGYLAVYDLIFTALLPVTDNLFARLAGLPFAPLFAWSAGAEGQWLALGLGDVLLAAVFPLVMHKAFGRRAGIMAMLVALAVICLLLVLPLAGLPRVTFPVMVVLGPLMIAQYLFWIRRCRAERTTVEYLSAPAL